MTVLCSAASYFLKCLFHILQTMNAGVIGSGLEKQRVLGELLCLYVGSVLWRWQRFGNEVVDVDHVARLGTLSTCIVYCRCMFCKAAID